MSTDRTTEILNYLSAISRDVGEFRTETNARLDRIEREQQEMKHEQQEMRREQREQRKLIDRTLAAIYTARADVRDLEDRVEVLENR